MRIAKTKIRVDTGGTFTDCWALDADSSPRFIKVLSSGRLRVSASRKSDKIEIQANSDWSLCQDFFTGYQAENHLGETSEVTGFDAETNCLTLEKQLRVANWIDLFANEEAPILAVRLITGTRLADSFPALDFRLATTRGTNALLENKGTPPLFFVTKGFRDLLEIGDQRRPDLFALNHQKRKPVYQSVVEVGERLDAEGHVQTTIDLEDPDFNSSIETALRSGVTTAAVALLHAYRNPEHEQKLGEYLLDAGFEKVSLSSELAPLIKLVPRAETTVANAYLTPVLDRFINHIKDRLGDHNTVLTMTSSGGLEPSEIYRPKDSLLSGPAGGITGAAAVARDHGLEKVITFDMGGTSTDVARYDGEFLYQFEQTIGDVRLLSTVLKIETVASGGGSICDYTEGGLRVGPESAGAEPGPACYGRGGPLTITDVNLLLNRIDAENFGIPISERNIESARQKAIELQQRAGITDPKLSRSFLEGLLEIAVEQMADAIRSISLRDGANPEHFALVAFGGAGPLHACELAEKLGIETLIIPAEAGILSAYGLEQALVQRTAENQVNLTLDKTIELDSILTKVKTEAKCLLEKINFECAQTRSISEVRLQGQDTSLNIDFESISQIETLFKTEYQSVYGYAVPEDRPIEVVTLRVIASTAKKQQTVPGTISTVPGTTQTVPGTICHLDRQKLPIGSEIQGPISIQDSLNTLYLPEGWTANVTETKSIVVTKAKTKTTDRKQTRSTEIERELFRHRFDRIVDEMGVMLQRSAISTNVKERLDFSCALLDNQGRLIASAHHIPVHLGALGICVRKVMATLPLRPGDTVITNHPGFGGSHLPDVTLITPVYTKDDQQQPIAFVANRAHHSEIGGISPGSMPPNATRLIEEGVVISPTYLVEAGESRFEQIKSLLIEAPYPSRNPADNLDDLHGQLAANLKGCSLVQELINLYSHTKVASQLTAQYDGSVNAMRSHLRNLKPAHSQQRLDDGTFISVTISPIDDRLEIDFSGTSPSHPGNLNATPAIVQSAVLYVVRIWLQQSLPLNEGLLDPITIKLPECFLNPNFDLSDPSNCPAVVGGNVETSQRLVDTLIEALAIQACSQGTMNNLIFGDDRFGYYETIAGGAGAGDGYHGASGLHTHMTNTAITDPEILETRYPVQLTEFSLRENSGGAGTWHGGDGVVRELKMLAPLKVSLLTQHRKEAPFGLAGGEPGDCGKQFIDSEPVDGCASYELKAGQVLRIETPGGGGYGKP